MIDGTERSAAVLALPCLDPKRQTEPPTGPAWLVGGSASSGLRSSLTVGLAGEPQILMARGSTPRTILTTFASPSGSLGTFSATASQASDCQPGVRVELDQVADVSLLLEGGDRCVNLRFT